MPRGVVAVAKSRRVPDRLCVVGSKCYYTVVVEDLSASKIVATATLLVEVLAVATCMPLSRAHGRMHDTINCAHTCRAPFRPVRAGRVMPRACALARAGSTSSCAEGIFVGT